MVEVTRNSKSSASPCSAGLVSSVLCRRVAWGSRRDSEMLQPRRGVAGFCLLWVSSRPRAWTRRKESVFSVRIRPLPGYFSSTNEALSLRRNEAVNSIHFALSLRSSTTPGGGLPANTNANLLTTWESARLRNCESCGSMWARLRKSWFREEEK